MLTGLTALQGVGKVADLVSEGADAVKNVTGSGHASFQTALADAASHAVDTLNNAEKLSVSALQGKADTREVVDAVMSAEQSLQAAIAIRDKIVSAYLDVTRMTI